jgi:hypothetical protein
MNRIIALALPCFLAFFILFGASSGFTSCTKTNTKTDTVDITKTDTLTKTDTVNTDTTVTLQILTANPWQLQSILGVTDDSVVYYTRGGQYNEDFDAQLYTFNANQTGTFLDGAGGSHTFTWTWSNSTNTQITMIISNPSPLPAMTNVFDNLRYKNSSLLFDQYWTYEGISSHSQCVMTPQTP